MDSVWELIPKTCVNEHEHENDGEWIARTEENLIKPSASPVLNLFCRYGYGISIEQAFTSEFNSNQ